MSIRQRNKASRVVMWSIAATATLFSGFSMADPCTAGGAIEVHGQHIIGDYVTGLGALLPPNELTWPPAGQVGQAVGANRGAAVPGGPGPAFHFALGLPPGASADFCNPNAHPNGFAIPKPFAPAE